MMQTGSMSKSTELNPKLPKKLFSPLAELASPMPTPSLRNAAVLSLEPASPGGFWWSSRCDADAGGAW
jgi:hypothetical protein